MLSWDIERDQSCPIANQCDVAWLPESFEDIENFYSCRNGLVNLVSCVNLVSFLFFGWMEAYKNPVYSKSEMQQQNPETFLNYFVINIHHNPRGDL